MRFRSLKDHLLRDGLDFSGYRRTKRSRSENDERREEYKWKGKNGSDGMTAMDKWEMRTMSKAKRFNILFEYNKLF
jgi:hypothetical protein